MKMQHTPGPWIVQKTYYRGHGRKETFVIVGGNGNKLHSPGGDAGTMRSPEPYCGYNFKEEDARLIAAAPELLEALMQIADPRTATQEPINIARAAIAKAQGE